METSWELSADDVTVLPVDVLAMATLRDFVDGEGWSAWNWMKGAEAHFGARSVAVKALAEAWAWLNSRGLVARDFRRSSADAVFVSRIGHRALADGLQEVRAVAELQMELHPILEGKVRQTYMVGDYDTAVAKAFKYVEIRVRKAIGAPNSLVGVPLMQEAFKEDGFFWSNIIDRGEQVARMELFKGAMGFLRNPNSHREVVYEDQTEAAEAVMLADLLMRILDHMEREAS
ncbi:MAG: TIGR02391 family protein [Actinomycetota bacterium]